MMRHLPVAQAKHSFNAPSSSSKQRLCYPSRFFRSDFAARLAGTLRAARIINRYVLRALNFPLGPIVFREVAGLKGRAAVVIPHASNVARARMPDRVHEHRRWISDLAWTSAKTISSSWPAEA